MEELNKECRKKGAKYLIVNRRYYDMILQALAKDQGYDDEEYFFANAETYRNLIVAVTDKADFTFKVL